MAVNQIYDRHFDASIRENMIDRKRIRLRYELASGQFGEVYKGKNLYNPHIIPTLLVDFKYFLGQYS